MRDLFESVLDLLEAFCWVNAVSFALGLLGVALWGP